MARTNIPAQSLIGAYPSLPISAGGADLTFTAADAVNGNSTPLVDNKTVLLAYNTDSAPHNVSVNSVADTLNRTGDITNYSVAAGKVAAFGPFKAAGWANSNTLQFSGADATVEFAVITLP